VTTARSDVDWIVTEHGAARLRGCSLRERAQRLIGIAHPEHRESLELAFRESATSAPQPEPRPPRGFP
jgi:acyl-CoA hydrolase